MRFTCICSFLVGVLPCCWCRRRCAAVGQRGTRHCVGWEGLGAHPGSAIVTLAPPPLCPGTQGAPDAFPAPRVLPMRSPCGPSADVCRAPLAIAVSVSSPVCVGLQVSLLYRDTCFINMSEGRRKEGNRAERKRKWGSRRKGMATARGHGGAN